MKNISRRSLLKGAGVGAAALGCAGLTGCWGSGGASTSVDESGTVTCESDYAGASSDRITTWLKKTVYDVDAQAEIAEELDAQKDGQTLEAPLISYNPFGTNSQTLYVYFVTDEPASVSYTVSISDEEAATIEDESFTAGTIADFAREVDGGKTATEHEFTLGGLIPNVENTVTITATYEDGASESHEFACEMCDVLGEEQLQLTRENGTSETELADGIYAVMGAEVGDVAAAYLYDNDGILRGEFPVIRRVQRFIEEDGLLYYSYTDTNVVAMNSIGQIVKNYTLNDEGDYTMHHDYIFASEGGDLLVLGTDKDSDTIEDIILTYDRETSELVSVLDMGDLMGAYKEGALEYHYANVDEEDEGANFDGEEGVDWLHVNGIQWLGNDSVLLSCREVSAIMKVSDIWGEPAIDYLISSKEYWEGTEHEDLVLDQVGDFIVQGGQHSIELVEDDSLEDGQYLVSMFNNNVGVSNETTSDFDYASIGLTNTMGSTTADGAYSYYYKYLVDENAGTFELVESIEVPFSGYISSVQDVDGHKITCSGTKDLFNEYDENDELIASYTMDIEGIVYRVNKFDW